MVLLYSGFSMDMEVITNNIVLQYIFQIGSEVAVFVEKHFVKELKKLESFKKKDYKQSLIDIFLKMD